MIKYFEIMKKRIMYIIAIVMLSISFGMAQQSYSPYLKTLNQEKAIATLSDEIISELEAKKFTVVGKYNPMQSNDLMVICFTRTDLQKASLSYKDRGAMASVLKIGLQKTNSGVSISLQNPMYMFYAYFRGGTANQKSALEVIDADAKKVLSDKYGKLSPFGGSLDADKLSNYHYKIMMPYFTDPVLLETYSSFDEGLAHIRAKLGKSLTVKKVYEQVYNDQQVAVFGLALNDNEDGEARFLPIIGESHLAALPYEIILQGKEVSMLHGKFRIALYWPELTMGTFMKIMSTPGDIEDAFKAVTLK